MCTEAHQRVIAWIDQHPEVVHVLGEVPDPTMRRKSRVLDRSIEVVALEVDEGVNTTRRRLADGETHWISQIEAAVRLRALHQLEGQLTDSQKKKGTDMIVIQGGAGQALQITAANLREEVGILRTRYEGIQKGTLSVRTLVPLMSEGPKTGAGARNESVEERERIQAKMVLDIARAAAKGAPSGGSSRAPVRSGIRGLADTERELAAAQPVSHPAPQETPSHERSLAVTRDIRAEVTHVPSSSGATTTTSSSRPGTPAPALPSAAAQPAARPARPGAVTTPPPARPVVAATPPPARPVVTTTPPPARPVVTTTPPPARPVVTTTPPSARPVAATTPPPPRPTQPAARPMPPPARPAPVATVPSAPVPLTRESSRAEKIAAVMQVLNEPVPNAPASQFVVSKPDPVKHYKDVVGRAYRMAKELELIRDKAFFNNPRQQRDALVQALGRPSIPHIIFRFNF